MGANSCKWSKSPDFYPICGQDVSKTQQKTGLTLRFARISWRSGWDSNPRALAGYLISSQARYDHFDTAPQFKRQARSLSFGINMVEVARLELAASWSLTMRATNCATPRQRITESLGRYRFRFGAENGNRTRNLQLGKLLLYH